MEGNEYAWSGLRCLSLLSPPSPTASPLFFSACSSSPSYLCLVPTQRMVLSVAHRGFKFVEFVTNSKVSNARTDAMMSDTDMGTAGISRERRFSSRMTDDSSSRQSRMKRRRCWSECCQASWLEAALGCEGDDGCRELGCAGDSDDGWMASSQEKIGCECALFRSSTHRKVRHGLATANGCHDALTWRGLLQAISSI